VTAQQPTTVYLAWTGSYSDTRVVGVYRSHDAALAVAKAFDPEDGRVEWAIIDGGAKPPEESGLALWSATSCCDGPEIDYCWKGESSYGDRDRNVTIGNVVPAYGSDKGDPMRVYVYARDEEHARKIAGDKFREHFALWGMRKKP